MAVVESIRNSVLDKILRGTNFTTQATHLSLHSANPGTTGASELSGGPGPYARQAITFAVASAGSAATSAAVSFSGLPAGTISHVGLWTASSGGTFLWGGAMAASKTAESGDAIEFPAGNITAPTTGA